MASQSVPDSDSSEESETERLNRKWDDILHELRVAQTGTQVLSGFLLTVAFQPRFVELDSAQFSLYLVLVALAAAATLLALAPVFMHRVYSGRGLKALVVKAGARFLIANLVLVAFLTVGVLVFNYTFV